MASERRVLAPLGVAVTVVLASVTTVLLSWSAGTGPREFLQENLASSWLAGLAYGFLGAVVLRHRDHAVLGRLFATAGLLAAVAALLASYVAWVAGAPPSAAADLVAWAAGWCWLPAVLVLWCAVPLVYPQGHLVSPAWRRAARVAVVAATIGVLSLATLPPPVPVDWRWSGLAGVARVLPPEGARTVVAATGVAVTAAIGLAAAVAIALRLRRSPSQRRQQEAWYVASCLVLVLAALLPLPLLVDLGAETVAVVALGTGVLHHRVVDIETLLPRVLVFLVLTAAVASGWFGAALLLGLGTPGGLWPTVLVSALALLLASGWRRAQRLVERWVFGARHDPLRALTAVGRDLDAVPSAEAALPVVLQTVRRSLRLPYAAVRWRGDALPPVEVGEEPRRTTGVPLRFAGDELGELVVGLAAGERVLARRDAGLLDALARQVAVTAHAALVEDRLRRSRERIVVAREDERRRIRRELHDGLGPTLAGIALGLETVAGRAGAGPDGAGRVTLEELRAETVGCVDEVRRIVADLRPVLLDELGLAAALRLQADRLSRDALQVGFAGPEALDEPVPAAVEAAAYRIALEAMTNAVRHSAGTRCEVELVLDPDAVRLRVDDDGVGTRPRVLGHGLAFMRERAEELGGWCAVTFRAGSGTSVRAEIPAGRERAAVSP